MIEQRLKRPEVFGFKWDEDYQDIEPFQVNKEILKIK